MIIRDYQKEDAGRVIEFHEYVTRETGVFVPGPWNDDMKDIDAIYIKPGGCFIIVEENNLIIGMGALKFLSENKAEIKRMRVAPAHQRKGIGQNILEYLISYARDHNIYKLILDTTELQKAAQQFYLKNAFSEYGRKTWNGHTLILYEKRLSE